jgi:uncharacterized protein (TIGR01777 family)
MRVLVLGGTGFIGRALVPALQRDGHTVVIWTRAVDRARARLGADIEAVDAVAGTRGLTSVVATCDAVINLAGEPVIGRWTAARREAIHSSRVGLTRQLIDAITFADRRPRVLVSGSAIGYYGDRGAEVLTENSPPGSGFLSDLARDWEARALEGGALGVRTVVLRTGVVLGRDGGAIAAMLPWFSRGLGGPIGSGRQYLSWIHLHDLVAIIVRSLHDETMRGPINAVSPEPVTAVAFATRLARALGRSAVLSVPAAFLRLAFGEASRVLLDSQRVQPAALVRGAFPFAFPTLSAALADIVGSTEVAIGPLQEPVDACGSETGRRYLAERRPSYELRTSTLVRAPIQQTFAFFSKAENLGLLTPSSMRFAIHGRVPRIAEDTVIDYRIRLGPVPLPWRSRIVSWVPGVRFVDLQERGPYRSWWHEHQFRDVGDCTLMVDRVCCAVPFGVFGRLVNRAFIVPTLRRIFEYRADVIRLRFGAAKDADECRSIA